LWGSSFPYETLFRAVENYQLAIQFDPNNAKTYCSCGDAHFHSQHYREAKEDYQTALKINPNLPNVS